MRLTDIVIHGNAEILGMVHFAAMHSADSVCCPRLLCQGDYQLVLLTLLCSMPALHTGQTWQCTCTCIHLCIRS